jgi:hypothetical protein
MDKIDKALEVSMSCRRLEGTFCNIEAKYIGKK